MAELTQNQIDQALASIRDLDSLFAARSAFRIPYWYEWNYWEPTVQLAMRDLCKPGDVVFDVGANAGALTVLLSRLVGPRGVVCAFEASARIIDKTQFNVVANGCGNVQIFHRAVSSSTGELVRIYAGTQLNDSIKPWAGTETAHVVETLAIDDFVRYWNLVPALIKMDIEGAELDALRGGIETIKRHRPYLILEQSPEDMGCHAMLTGLGYVAIDLATYREIVSAADFSSGVVVANVLYIDREKLRDNPYSVPIPRQQIATLAPGDLGDLSLPQGRLLLETRFTASGTDNELMAGIESSGKEIFRYHSNSHFLGLSYRDWPIHLDRPATARLFFNFLHGTSDPTFAFEGASVWRLPSFDAAPTPLV